MKAVSQRSATASPKIRGPQAGQSTFIFSYKAKVFQGTFSEQEPPPRQEGICREGVQTAQSCCSQLHPLCTTDRSTARPLPLGQPSSAGFWSDRTAALHMPCVYPIGNRGSLPKGALSSPQKAPAAVPVGTPAGKGLACCHCCISAAFLSRWPGLAPYEVKDITSAMGDFRLGFHIFLLQKSLSLQSKMMAPQAMLSHCSDSKIHDSSG